MLARNHYSAIVLDLMMPRVDGVGVVKYLTEHDSETLKNVIVLTAFGAKALIMSLMPASLQVITVPEWWSYSALISLAGALLGAIYPGLKAARQDAIEALAYD